MDSNRTVTPVNPAAPYLSGKKNLTKGIIARIEAVEKTYSVAKTRTGQPRAKELLITGGG